MSFSGIYFNQSRVPGEVRMSPDGLGWRATPPAAGSRTAVSKPFLLPSSELVSATWSKGAHDYLLQIQTKSGATVSLDGFADDQFSSLQRALSGSLDLSLEHREHSLRGWNWGRLDFERSDLVLSVASKPDFEVPYSSIQSSNLVGKSEVAVELVTNEDRTTAGDEVVELRFYIPGQAGSEETDNAENAGESNAQIFHDELQERADVGAAVGSELVQFTQVLFTTPRGRYDVQLFAETFRLHGKTYDYKVAYASLQRIFQLPRLDDVHTIVVLQLDPPLRQGQTRYPFLVLQVARNEETEVELNVEESEFDEKFGGRLQRHYDGPAPDVLCSLLEGLSGRKTTGPGSFVSARGLPAVAAMTRAVEANVYPLDRAVLIISKAPMYIPYVDIDLVRFTRMATGHRTFDLAFKVKGEKNDVQLTGVAKDEHPALEQFFDSKDLKIRDDAVEARKRRVADLDDEMDVEDSEEDEDFDEDEDDEGSESGSGSGSGSGSDDDDDEEDDDESGAESFDEFSTGDSKIEVKSEKKRARR